MNEKKVAETGMKFKTKKQSKLSRKELIEITDRRALSSARGGSSIINLTAKTVGKMEQRKLIEGEKVRKELHKIYDLKAKLKQPKTLLVQFKHPNKIKNLVKFEK